MPRSPFVWKVHIRREVLDDEVEKLRDLPYTIWRDVVHTPMARTVVGRDGASYRVAISAAYESGSSENIRVTVTLRSPRLGRRLGRARFVIAPSNEFVA